MRIVESRADHLQLRSSDTVLGAGAAGTSSRWGMVAYHPAPRRSAVYGVGTVFILIAAAVMLSRARTLRVEPNSFGPSRWFELASLVRRRDYMFQAQLATGLRCCPTGAAWCRDDG